MTRRSDDASGPVGDIVTMLGEMELDVSSPHDPAIQKAIQLTRALQLRGVSLQTSEEKRQQRELELMMSSDSDKATLIQMTDQAFRSSRARRAAEQMTHILDVQGIPRFFSAIERAMLKGFQSFGSYLPGVSVPLVKDRMRAETANVILPAEPEVLAQHLADRREHGVRMNVNYLGEALLGEEDAQRRLESYLAALQLPEIEVISVKISTIYSQISSLARRRSIRELCDRMELLYRASARARFIRADGTVVPKFVYLDMEEYRDLSITLEVFTQTLDRPGLERVEAGIALQAYLPDSADAQRTITRWARRRVAAGGAPVTIRVVKGANMEMECVEASIEGWTVATYVVKADTDANFKRMVQYGLQPENAAAVKLGIASHNLFDLSYGLVLAVEGGLLGQVQFEMLEGMANHQRRALSELAPNLLLYAPATRREDFVNAIGYLIRRLDENTGPDNFLRHAFKLEVGSEQWTLLERGFVESFGRIPTVRSAARREQNRSLPSAPRSGPLLTRETFQNEPDTDFALAANYAWAEGILAEWKGRCGEQATRISLVVGGEEITTGRKERTCLDPSRPGVVVGRYLQAESADIDRALECAATDPSGWRTMGESERGEVLSRVATELRNARGSLMGAALADGGKLLSESDPEVSEAIDFVEYYALTARDLRGLDSVKTQPKGVVVVVPPWNFPIAIPCGGVAAALASGNTVILKPASHTVLVAWELCQCFWRGGVPREALQFAPCSGATGGARLVASDIADVVILTGGTDTALRMLDARPEMNLLAETGGKNGTIVTAMSDREQAIGHLMRSAFGHGGQKCSATSLLVLEAEVYDDPRFRATLCDAAESLRVGSAWELDTRLGPLIHAPGGDLERGLKELETGESWALMPHRDEDNPGLYSPAIKWGVSPESYTHLTEFFGPVLAVIRAHDLDEAIDIVNATGYGLTSGLESLDLREQARWKDGIRAGNLYVNRVTTGAIVHRQPFGGVGKSAFGPGIKAGGPNYVAQLMDFTDRADLPAAEDVPLKAAGIEALRQLLLARHASGEHPPALVRLLRAMASYERAWEAEFGREHDDFRLLGQDNIRRYRPVSALRVRVHPDDDAFDIFARVCAARTVGCRVTISVPPSLEPPMVELLDRLTEPWGAAIEFVEETDAELAVMVASGGTDRVRYAAPDRVPKDVLRAVGDSGIYIARSPVLAEGRIELLWYLTEQSISDTYHRYGNLGARAGEERGRV